MIEHSIPFDGTPHPYFWQASSRRETGDPVFADLFRSHVGVPSRGRSATGLPLSVLKTDLLAGRSCWAASPEALSWEGWKTLCLSRCAEEEEFYKLLPANKADHLCQLWQSCSDLHNIQTVYDIVENPHSIRLSKK